MGVACASAGGIGTEAEAERTCPRAARMSARNVRAVRYKSGSGYMYVSIGRMKKKGIHTKGRIRLIDDDALGVDEPWLALLAPRTIQARWVRGGGGRVTTSAPSVSLMPWRTEKR